MVQDDGDREADDLRKSIDAGSVMWDQSGDPGDAWGFVLRVAVVAGLVVVASVMALLWRGLS